MVIVALNNPNMLGIGGIDHRRQMRRVEDGIRVRQPLEHPEQIFLAGVVKVYPWFFEQQNAILEFTPARMGELPSEGHVPTKPGGSPMQADRHTDTAVFSEDIQGRTINLDVKFYVLLTPKILELLG